MQEYHQSSAHPQVAGDAADPIVPIDFSPPDPHQKRVGFRLRWPHILVAGFLLLAGVSGWFILSARSVYLDVTPLTARVEIQSGFSLQIGQRYLMLPGDYPVLLRNEGYHDEQVMLSVGTQQAQNHPFALRELPGIVSVEALGVSGALSGAMVQLDGAEIGHTPLRNMAIEPGEYTLTIAADRYLPYSQSIKVEGRSALNPFSTQLQQAWGEFSFSTTPAGAEVLIDGQVLGTTPYRAEIQIGRAHV